MRGGPGPGGPDCGHGRRRGGTHAQRGGRGTDRPRRARRAGRGGGARNPAAGPRHLPAGPARRPRRHRGDGDRPYTLYAGERVTYAQHRARVAALARRYAQLGLRAGRPRGDLPAQLPGVGTVVLGSVGLGARRGAAERLVAVGRARPRGGRRGATARGRRRRTRRGAAGGDGRRRRGGRGARRGPGRVPFGGPPGRGDRRPAPRRRARPRGRRVHPLHLRDHRAAQGRRRDPPQPLHRRPQPPPDRRGRCPSRPASHPPPRPACCWRSRSSTSPGSAGWSARRRPAPRSRRSTAGTPTRPSA